MTPSFILAIVAFLALVSFSFLVRYLLIRRFRRMSAATTVSWACGRSIVVGERHTDRVGLQRILTLIDAAHEQGYRTLGVEVSEEGNDDFFGLHEELTYLRRLGPGALSEYDDDSYMEEDATGRSPRMNRHWYMRAALGLGWRIVAIDPHHWNWMSGTAAGYTDSREPAMADAIRTGGKMVAIVGYGHLQGLVARLDVEAAFIVATHVRTGDAKEAMWAGPTAFAATLPRLDC